MMDKEKLEKIIDKKVLEILDEDGNLKPEMPLSELVGEDEVKKMAELSEKELLMAILRQASITNGLLTKLVDAFKKNAPRPGVKELAKKWE